MPAASGPPTGRQPAAFGPEFAELLDDVNCKYESLGGPSSFVIGFLECHILACLQQKHSLFFDGQDGPKMTRHNHLPQNVLQWFHQKFNHYLQWNKVVEYKMHLNSVWVNTMFEHEYNPVHVHQGSLFTGLSSVMILKLPPSFGVEYSSPDAPQNGRLQILGSSSGQFANVDYQPNIKERDFYIFPYDMRHTVYPFNGPGMRRTLAANMDVEYNPIKNRGVS